MNCLQAKVCFLFWYHKIRLTLVCQMFYSFFVLQNLILVGSKVVRDSTLPQVPSEAATIVDTE